MNDECAGCPAHIFRLLAPRPNSETLMKRLFAAGLLFLVGCAPATLDQAPYSPDAIASAAMARYDANKDGKIDTVELKLCPSIAAGLADIDTNKDKAVGQDELQARLAAYIESKMALRDVELRILRGSKGAANVTVTFVPEEFMGGTVKAATGVTNDFGTASYKTEGQTFPGVAPGFYKVQLSQKDSSGKELLPARFNSETIHGIEIGIAPRMKYTPIDLEK
jgi:hypothetical protein